jgi:predicted signal transduction protein with EAL and GGDEF domain
MSKPEKVFKMGAVRASVFVNMIERDGKLIELRKVVLEVRYRDKNGQWQGTNSLSINDLPKAITALQQAYEYLLSGAAPDGTGPSEAGKAWPAYQQPARAA